MVPVPQDENVENWEAVGEEGPGDGNIDGVDDPPDTYTHNYNYTYTYTYTSAASFDPSVELSPVPSSCEVSPRKKPRDLAPGTSGTSRTSGKATGPSRAAAAEEKWDVPPTTPLRRQTSGGSDGSELWSPRSRGTSRKKKKTSRTPAEKAARRAATELQVLSAVRDSHWTADW